jgi:hypothetical protein
MDPNPTTRRFQVKNSRQSICLTCFRTVTAVSGMTMEEANAFHALYCQGRPQCKSRILKWKKL